MKKILSILSIAIFVLLTGCANKNENLNEVQAKVSGECVLHGEKMPKWICSGGNVQGYITAVGSAKKTPLGFTFQRTEAITLARDELARQISTKIKNMVKTYMASIGANNEASDKVVEQVSKQVSYLTLNGSKQLNIYIDKEGNMYVLVGVPVKNIKEAIRTSLHNNKALWQKKQSEKAQKELDNEIEKEFL